MPSVTVLGANGQVVTQTYDTARNAIIAQQLAGAITNGIEGSSLVASSDTTGGPTPLKPGQIGSFTQNLEGPTVLPPGYNAYVSNAKSATVVDSGAGTDSVLAGATNLTFDGSASGGTIVGGAGNNQIHLSGSGSDGWDVALGGGYNQVFALGAGNDTVSVGGGDSIRGVGTDRVVLGAGNDLVDTSASRTTVVGGSGNDTITASSPGQVVLYGGSGTLTFIGEPGTRGQVASDGNETLRGAHSSGNDTLGGGVGNDTMQAGTGHDLFAFAKGSGGVIDIQNFTAQDGISLQGFQGNEADNALKTAQVANGSTTITLSDNTKITFAGFTDLTKTNFHS